MNIWLIIPIALAVTVVTAATSANGEIIPRLVSKIALIVKQFINRSLKRSVR